MLTFYEEFLSKIQDDQERYDANHPDDTGALPDVVPYDGIGGNFFLCSLSYTHTHSRAHTHTQTQTQENRVARFGAWPTLLLREIFMYHEVMMLSRFYESITKVSRILWVGTIDTQIRQTVF